MVSAYTYGDGDYATITILPVNDDDDAPGLAGALGLKQRIVSLYPGSVFASIERWQGRVGPAHVTTHHKIATPIGVLARCAAGGRV